MTTKRRRITWLWVSVLAIAVLIGLGVVGKRTSYSNGWNCGERAGQLSGRQLETNDEAFGFVNVAAYEAPNPNFPSAEQLDELPAELGSPQYVATNGELAAVEESGDTLIWHNTTPDLEVYLAIATATGEPKWGISSITRPVWLPDTTEVDLLLKANTPEIWQTYDWDLVSLATQDGKQQDCQRFFTADTEQLEDDLVSNLGNDAKMLREDTLLIRLPDPDAREYASSPTPPVLTLIDLSSGETLWSQADYDGYDYLAVSADAVAVSNFYDWDDEDREVVVLDANSGDEVWRDNNVAIPLAFATGNRLIVSEGEAVAAYDETGKKFWRVKTAEPAKEALTIDDLVVISFRAETMAIDAATGEIRWQLNRTIDLSEATEFEGQLYATDRSAFIKVDLETGDVTTDELSGGISGLRRLANGWVFTVSGSTLITRDA